MANLPIRRDQNTVQRTVSRGVSVASNRVVGAGAGAAAGGLLITAPVFFLTDHIPVVSSIVTQGSLLHTGVTLALTGGGSYLGYKAAKVIREETQSAAQKRGGIGR